MHSLHWEDTQPHVETSIVHVILGVIAGAIIGMKPRNAIPLAGVSPCHVCLAPPNTFSGINVADIQAKDRTATTVQMDEVRHPIACRVYSESPESIEFDKDHVLPTQVERRLVSYLGINRLGPMH